MSATTRWTMTGQLTGDLTGLRALLERTAPIIHTSRHGYLIEQHKTARRATGRHHRLVRARTILIVDMDALNALPIPPVVFTPDAR